MNRQNSPHGSAHPESFEVRAEALSPAFVLPLRHSMMLPGCGHWTQQERAAEVNAAMLEFLKTL